MLNEDGFLLRFDSEIKNMEDVYYRLLLFGANLPKCESDKFSL